MKMIALLVFFLWLNVQVNAANWDIIYDGSVAPDDKSLGKNAFLFGDAKSPGQE